MNSNFVVSKFSNKCWYNEEGVLHRDGDLPAVEYANGSKAWWKNGLRHRGQDKPAVENVDGGKEWFKNGVKLSPQEVEALKRKWTAIRNGDTTLLAEELLNEL